MPASYICRCRYRCCCCSYSKRHVNFLPQPRPCIHPPPTVPPLPPTTYHPPPTTNALAPALSTPLSHQSVHLPSRKSPCLLLLVLLHLLQGAPSSTTPGGLSRLFQAWVRMMRCAFVLCHSLPVLGVWLRGKWRGVGDEMWDCLRVEPASVPLQCLCVLYLCLAMFVFLWLLGACMLTWVNPETLREPSHFPRS